LGCSQLCDAAVRRGSASHRPGGRAGSSESGSAGKRRQSKEPSVNPPTPLSPGRQNLLEPLMYHEDVADECSADEEKEEPDQRQRRAVTTPPVLTLADAGTPGDVYWPVERVGPGKWRATQMVPPIHARGTSGMVSATREDESMCPAPPPPPSHCPIHTPSYAQAAALAAATPPVNPRSSRDCPS